MDAASVAVRHLSTSSSLSPLPLLNKHLPPQASERDEDEEEDEIADVEPEEEEEDQQDDDAEAEEEEEELDPEPEEEDDPEDEQPMPAQPRLRIKLKIPSYTPSASATPALEEDGGEFRSSVYEGGFVADCYCVRRGIRGGRGRGGNELEEVDVEAGCEGCWCRREPCVARSVCFPRLSLFYSDFETDLSLCRRRTAEEESSQ